MSESSSTPSQTSGSRLHEGDNDHDLTDSNLTEGLDLGFDGAEDVLRAWRRGMRPDADLTMSEWADAHRWLSSRASAEPGRYRTARTPYGTPPASGYTRMPFASTTLGAEQPLLNSELLGYGRDPLAPIKDALTADGDVVVPIDANAFGFWLKAAFGAPTTTGTAPGPYSHEFRSGGWVLPSVAIEVAMAALALVVLTIALFILNLRRTAERAGRAAERLDQLEQTHAIHRQMLDAAARRPRSRDDLFDRLRDGGF